MMLKIIFCTVLYTPNFAKKVAFQTPAKGDHNPQV
jgi:hypothetical protein